MKKTKKPERYAIDEREIASKHFAHLTRLVREEERLDKGRYKTEVLDRAPEERERRGKALLRLVLLESTFNASGQRLLTFGSATRRPLPRYGIQVGDIIRLSGRETPEADRPAGTVYEKERMSITVAFGRAMPGWVGTEQLYHLNITENQTTYDRMFEALREVGHAEHSQIAYLRNISLGLRKARSRDPVDPKKISFFNSRLNDLQKKAVAMALEIEDVMLIHGPPGTGKTCVLIEVILQARKNGENVLVSAPSNAACDHLLLGLVEAGVPATRLGNPARMTEKLRGHTLSFKIANHPYAKLIYKIEARLDQITRQTERRQDRRMLNWEQKRETKDEIYALRNEVKTLRHEMFEQVWKASDVVVATHTVCGDPLLKGKTFGWVIIDEATQAVEPATWIPVLHAGKLILAGDHCQLPPTVFSFRTGNDTLKFSLFERFYEKLDDHSKIRLHTQYRMNKKIMDFSSREFYEDALKAHSSVQGHDLSDLKGVEANDFTKAVVTFLDTAGLGYEEKTEPGSQSRLNPEEARLVVRQFKLLVDAGVKENDIAVISPYSAQVKHLSGLLQKDEWDAERGIGPEVDSIDAFQGREKEAVIVSLVRSNLTGQIGFLGDTRRMNVAMTRAKRKLIVIGDSSTISNLPFYEKFLKYVESVGGYASAWEYVS